MGNDCAKNFVPKKIQKKVLVPLCVEKSYNFRFFLNKIPECTRLQKVYISAESSDSCAHFELLDVWWSWVLRTLSVSKDGQFPVKNVKMSWDHLFMACDLSFESKNDTEFEFSTKMTFEGQTRSK